MIQLQSFIFTLKSLKWGDWICYDNKYIVRHYVCVSLVSFTSNVCRPRMMANIFQMVNISKYYSIEKKWYRTMTNLFFIN